MNTHTLLSVAVLSASGLAMAAPASAQVIFSEDFDDANGQAVADVTPDVGLGFRQTNGPAVIVTDGAIDTTGAARTIFGDFTTTSLDASTPYLDVTADFTKFNFNEGYAGVSLYSGDQEIFFFGDPGGGDPATESIGIDARTTDEFRSGVRDLGLYTFRYDSITGEIALYSGSTASGSPLVSAATGEIGLSFDSFRIENGSGGDIGVSSIVVAANAVPEPSTALLGGLGMLTLVARRRR